MLPRRRCGQVEHPKKIAKASIPTTIWKPLTAKGQPCERVQGKVVLLVNVASKCGNTPQYKALEALHEKYGKEASRSVGVPCNQFHAQEPGSAKDIAESAKRTYGVKFGYDVESRFNGEKAAPLYKQLTSKDSDPKFPGKITWTSKVSLNRRWPGSRPFFRRGRSPIRRSVAAIEKELAKKK